MQHDTTSADEASDANASGAEAGHQQWSRAKLSDETIRARGTALAAFHAEHGRWPNADATDDNERQLATWRRYFAQGRTDEGHKAILDEVVPGWAPGSQRPTFEQHVEALREHRARTSQMPSAASTDAEERRLAQWRQRTLRADLTPAQQHLIDTRVPDWRARPSRPGLPDDTVRARGVALAEFHAQHGRWPSPRATDADERRLAKWRHTFAQTKDDAGRKAILDEVAPGWVPGSQRPTFEQRVEALRKHRATTGQWPSSAGEDPEERHLAKWRERMRRADLTPAQQDHIDARVPGWRETTRSEPRPPRGIAVTAGNFYAEHGRVPNVNGETAEERNLARALAKLRHGDRPASPRLREELDAACPRWGGPDVAVPADTAGLDPLRVAELAAFWERALRRPSPSSLDQQERSLATWLNRVRSARSTPERDAVLRSACPTWDERIGHPTFESNVEHCARFVAAKGRFPTSSDTEVAALVWWLTHAARRVSERRAELDARLPGWRQVTSDLVPEPLPAE